MERVAQDEELLASAFQARFGEPAEKVVSLKGDGSARRIFRLSSPRRSAVGVVHSDLQENRAFIQFSRHFRAAGLPVPEIYAESAEKGLYLEEDLGETTLFDFLSGRRSPAGLDPEVLGVYREALRLLPRFQITTGRTLDYSVCYPRAAFDRQSMLWDLNHFKYYFLKLGGIPFHEQALEDDFSRFAGFLLEARRDYFLYRDFQSRNIMVKGGKPWFIDYQGGRRGALQYDVASLLFDAKADLPPEARDALLGAYLEEASALAPVGQDEFMRHYHGYVLIRILQALGAFGLRGFYEKKPHFLQSIPYAIRNLERLLRTAELPVELPALAEVLRRLVTSSYLRQISDVELSLAVRVQSFCYRDGMPADEKGHGGGHVFDCRALPNPGRHDRFARLTGKDPEVAAFLDAEPEVGRFMEHVFALTDQSVENYRKRNFTDLLVAFGCTGGRHRSVYCAERLARHLREGSIRAEVRHRALEKGGRAP